MREYYFICICNMNYVFVGEMYCMHWPLHNLRQYDENIIISLQTNRPGLSECLIWGGGGGNKYTENTFCHLQLKYRPFFYRFTKISPGILSLFKGYYQKFKERVTVGLPHDQFWLFGHPKMGRKLHTSMLLSEHLNSYIIMNRKFIYFWLNKYFYLRYFAVVV